MDEVGDMRGEIRGSQIHPAVMNPNSSHPQTLRFEHQYIPPPPVHPHAMAPHPYTMAPSFTDYSRLPGWRKTLLYCLLIAFIILVTYVCYFVYSKYSDNGSMNRAHLKMHVNKVLQRAQSLPKGHQTTQNPFFEEPSSYIPLHVSNLQEKPL